MDGLSVARTACELGVGAWLVFNATGKALDVTQSAQILRTYSMIPSVAGAPLARVLVVTEGVLGGFLLLGMLQPWSLLAGSVLLVAFAMVVGWELVHGRRHSCGCGGGADASEISWPLVLRNLGVAMVGFGFLLSHVGVGDIQARLILLPALLAVPLVLQQIKAYGAIEAAS